MYHFNGEKKKKKKNGNTKGKAFRDQIVSSKMSHFWPTLPQNSANNRKSCKNFRLILEKKKKMANQQ